MQRGMRPGRCLHYKGQYYQVIDVARHSETKELMVVYRCLYGERTLWVRPLEMFLATVDANGKQVPRFAWSPGED